MTQATTFAGDIITSNARDIGETNTGKSLTITRVDDKIFLKCELEIDAANFPVALTEITDDNLDNELQLGQVALFLDQAIDRPEKNHKVYISAASAAEIFLNIQVEIDGKKRESFGV